ncbi:hypothetical protein SALBM217S_05044 [Streptomyces griseoloalbus]
MPRITKEEKARNRQNIVEAAGRMFRARGIDAVGIADLMKEAGLTHGGFYNHFASKDDLAAEVCNASFAASLGVLRRAVERGLTRRAGSRVTGRGGLRTARGHAARRAWDRAEEVDRGIVKKLGEAAASGSMVVEAGRRGGR